MKRKTVIAFSLIFIVSAFSGCGETEDYSAWLKTGSVKQVATPNDNVEPLNKKLLAGLTDSSKALEAFSDESVFNAYLSRDEETLAYEIWQRNISSGVYAVTEDDLRQNKLVYYVSSSEGNDENFGLSADSPKKSLMALSGVPNITVLLKCGDEFEIDGTFRCASGAIYATYGTGKRPIVNMYGKLNAEFNKVPDTDNIWVADLSTETRIFTGEANKDNCNIGHLVINGKTNWKRIPVSSGEILEYDFAGKLKEDANESWAVDYANSLLYIYSDTNPNEAEILYAPNVTAIAMDSVKKTVLKGWEITGTGSNALNITNSVNVKVASCHFSHIGGSVKQASGTRYGNAVQVWNSAQDIVVERNYADWIYNTCYTNQGSSQSATGKNIVFRYNIGRHAFTGIETLADSFSDNTFEKIHYYGNVLGDMCDITDPDKQLFADEKGKVIVYEGLGTYKSYRGGYPYNQMTCINAVDSNAHGELQLYGNVCENTNRLILLLGSSENLPVIENNTFYSSVNSSDVCLFRYNDTEGHTMYLKDCPVEGNQILIADTKNTVGNEQNLLALKTAISEVAGK